MIRVPAGVLFAAGPACLLERRGGAARFAARPDGLPARRR
jgi:hypothetical protein